jgi:hypothetical protein
MGGMGAQRDPLSVPFDAGARRLLDRAYARPGIWIATRIADPTIRQRTRVIAMGINPSGPDPVRALPGKGVDARDRWTRAFIRALYYQHKWYSGKPGGGWRRRSSPRSASALEVEIGRRLVPKGELIPAGRAIRIRVRRGGTVARHAVERLPDSRRIYRDDGSAGDRWSDPAVTRDWGWTG